MIGRRGIANLKDISRQDIRVSKFVERKAFGFLREVHAIPSGCHGLLGCLPEVVVGPKAACVVYHSPEDKRVRIEPVLKPVRGSYREAASHEEI